VHCAGLRSSVTHGIGSITDIPQLSNGFNSKDDPYNLQPRCHFLSGVNKLTQKLMIIIYQFEVVRCYRSSYDFGLNLMTDF